MGVRLWVLSILILLAVFARIGVAVAEGSRHTERISAIEDLSEGLEFDQSCSDILHERGIVNFKFKDYNAAVEDLSACVKHVRKNNFAYTYLGRASSAIGEYQRAEEAHLTAIQLDENFLEGWAHLAQYPEN